LSPQKINLTPNCTYILTAIAKAPIAKIIKVENGFIKGKKSSPNKWDIEISIDTHYPFKDFILTEDGNIIKVSQSVPSCL